MTDHLPDGMNGKWLRQKSYCAFLFCLGFYDIGGIRCHKHNSTISECNRMQLQIIKARTIRQVIVE